MALMNEDKPNRRAEEEEKLKPKRSPREFLASRNPDLDIDDDEAVTSYLEQELGEYDNAKKQQAMINDMLAKDDRSAGVLTGLFSGKGADGEPFSLVGYLVENYGADLLDSMSTEEAVEKAKKREAAIIKEEADKAARQKELELNLKTTDEALTKAVQETGIDDKTVADLLDWLYSDDEERAGLIHRFIRNQLDANDWTRLIYAFIRDAEISRAEQKGAAHARSSSSRASMHRDLSRQAPTDLGGGTTGDYSERREKDPMLSHLDSMKRKF